MKQVSNYSRTSVTLKFETHVPADRVADIAERNPRELGRVFGDGGIKEMTLTEKRVIRLVPDAPTVEVDHRAIAVQRAINGLVRAGIDRDSAGRIVTEAMNGGQL